MSEIRNRTVYMLCRTDGGNDTYIGSTLQSLDSRFAVHKYHAGNPSQFYEKSKLYQKMRDVGVHRWRMVPLITLSCDQDTVLACEKVWIEATGANLNTFSPVREDVDEREYDRQCRKKIKKKKGIIANYVILHVQITTI